LEPRAGEPRERVGLLARRRNLAPHPLGGLDRRQHAQRRVVVVVRQTVERRAVGERRLGMTAEQLVPYLAPALPRPLGLGGANLRVEREDPPLPVEQRQLVHSPTTTRATPRSEERRGGKEWRR